MNREEYIKLEAEREVLIGKAEVIAKESITSGSPYIDSAYIDEEGVVVAFIVSHCGCCQGEQESVRVTWEELGIA